MEQPARLRLALDRVLGAFELSRDGRGRRAYIGWLEARAADHAGTIGEPAMQALRRGWYLGEEGFKDRLLKMLERPDPPQRAGEARRPPRGRRGPAADPPRACDPWPACGSSFIAPAVQGRSREGNAGRRPAKGDIGLQQLDRLSLGHGTSGLGEPSRFRFPQ